MVAPPSLPSGRARSYWSAVTIAGLVLLGTLFLTAGPRRAAAGFILAGFVWAGGLLGQWAVGALVPTTPRSALARAAIGAFGLLPIVGLFVLSGALLPSPLIDVAYVALWATGFIAFAMLLFLLARHVGR